jgi:phasin family protein
MLDIYGAMQHIRDVAATQPPLTTAGKIFEPVLSGKPNQKAARSVGMIMNQQFETIQKAGKEQFDAVVKSFGVTTKGLQAVATETTDFAKKSFESSTAAFEKLAATKTLDKAIEVQTDFVKSAFEGYVAQATKIGELFTSIAKDAVKPYEGIIAKATPVATK